MKKIIEAIKALFSSKTPATYAEVKKESIDELYKLEPKKKAKKKPTKKKKDGSK